MKVRLEMKGAHGHSVSLLCSYATISYVFCLKYPLHIVATLIISKCALTSFLITKNNKKNFFKWLYII